ncbi:sugar ABC transporter substrate-binding protein [Mangrovactinospora gilvigrisea]|uniref:Sugar ABC transporter substrate-binding protein n=1 Tax=Mangrovactinospora gilvigrisea TaxID=1428644 RepID=A0A1J7BA07_9ACTN|nr:extracellular solute-binding protein [Mangrovactinospora gilvigrisea]OIV35519.1 sugar ABC transporter substrate-binding protein [Mangrovactinospora gilvigrisea]
MSAVSGPHRPSRRAILRSAGALAALGPLAACGNNNGRGGSSSGGGKSISQWYHQYGEKGTQQAAQKFAKAYKKADVSIQWVAGDYGSKLSAGLLSSSGPDVFEDQPNIQMVKAKQAVPLDDIVGPVKGDYLPADIASHTIDGKIYGVRMIDDPQFFYYRKSLFAKAGVQVPTTLDELIAAAAKLTNGKMKGVFLGNDLHGIAAPLVWSAGADTLTADHKPAYHTDAVVGGLKSLRTLWTSGHLLTGAPTDYTDPGSFLNELCAIQFCGMWAMPAILAKFPGDVGVFPFPKVGDAGKLSVYNGGWSAFVSSKAKDVDAAKAFVKWLWIDQTAYQKEWALNYGFHIPPRASIRSQATKLQSGVAADGVKLFNTYGHFDNPAFTPAMATALQAVLADSVRSGGDPGKALDKCDTTVNGQLKQLFG